MTRSPDSLPDLSGLRECISCADARDPAVSAWSVGQHVAHCSLALRSITKALLRSKEPPPRSARGGLWRAGVLGLGWIPRGRGKAPDAVMPPADPRAEELHDLLDEGAELLRAVSHVGPGAWFEHFALGVLDRDQALRFLAVHDDHHLKIVRDIVRRQRPDVSLPRPRHRSGARRAE